MFLGEAHDAGTTAKTQLLLVPGGVSGCAVPSLEDAIVQGIHLHVIAEFCAASEVLDSLAPWHVSHLNNGLNNSQIISCRCHPVCLFNVGSTRSQKTAQILCPLSFW